MTEKDQKFTARAEANIGSHLPQFLHHDRQEIYSSGETRKADGSESNVVVKSRRQMLPPPVSKLAAVDKRSCKMLPNTDYWGEAIVWGPQNKVDSAEECCQKCATYSPTSEDDMSCNVWVWCGDKDRCKGSYRDCWLKHLAHPEAVNPATGPKVPWTSGLTGAVDMVEDDPKQVGGSERRYHVVITAQGSAVHWQARVHYYWYKKVRAQCEEELGVDCQMGGFTRILHSGHPDELMDEIPTHVVQPLQDRDNKGYVVLNRPYAFVQWLQTAVFPERYVLMSEPDHLWLRPMPNLMIDNHRPTAFPFFYIEPAKKDFKPLTEKFTGPLTLKQAESIAPMGNAPTLMSLKSLRRVAPTWMNVSKAIFDDKEAHEAWGWVLEMYAFTIACYMEGLPTALLHIKMMAQPPWDTKLWPYYLLHYTYGMDYNATTGEHMPGKYGEWRFDKRSYAQFPPPRRLAAPPDVVSNELVRKLIDVLNEATSVIPGWDDYAKTGIARQLWNGNIR
ncbi:g5763 [Coccomyxa elongata]